MFFSGPYYSFYSMPTPEELSSAYALIWDVIEEEGPFDGIVGFSQGGALASSFLLDDLRSPHPQLPFKCAIFFCSSMPFDSRSRPFTVHPITGETRHADTGKVIPDFKVTDSIPETASAGWSGTFDENTQFLHRYTSKLANIDRTKINIPTAHIVGSADAYYKQGCQLQELLCEPENRHVVTHRGGHDIPKDVNTTAKMAGCIQQMIHDVLVG